MSEFTDCHPPQHHWSFDGYGRSTCTCGETTAERVPSGDGWMIRLVDGQPLITKNRVDLPPGPIETALRATVTPGE